MRGQAGADTRLGALMAMTASAVGALAPDESLARPMNRGFSELRFLGPDQGGVVVAFRAAEISSHDCFSHTSRALRTSRARWALRTSRTSRASRTGRAIRTSRARRTSLAGTGNEDQHGKHSHTDQQ